MEKLENSTTTTTTKTDLANKNTAIPTETTNVSSVTHSPSQPTTPCTTPKSLYLPRPTGSTPSLRQITKQNSVNFRLSQLSDSGAESCTETDEQSRLIRSPSARSHKYIIIPAAAISSQAVNASQAKITPFRQTISTSSLAALQKNPTYTPLIRRQLSSLSQTYPNIPDSGGGGSGGIGAGSTPQIVSVSNISLAQGLTHWPTHIPAVVSNPVTFTIEDFDTEHAMNIPFYALNNTNMMMIDQTPTEDDNEHIISLINSAEQQPSTSTAATETTNDNTHLKSLNQLLAFNRGFSTGINLRQRYGDNTSIRSVISAGALPTLEPSLSSQHLQLPLGRELSAMYHDQASNQIYSDVTSVRSLASIGIGSTDGKKIVIRRVPYTADELFNPCTTTQGPLGADDDDDSFMDMSDETANLKPRQQHWANKMQFVLACVGYSVGLGNVWRFPYMCYKSGGGVFLVPYCIILFICSIPLLFMELSVGQYTGRGPIGALGQLCPLFKGAGLASVVVSFLMSTYFSVIIGYSIYYFFTAFKPDMPWSDCNNRWNSEDCWVPQRFGIDTVAPNSSKTPSEEFFEKKVLQISPGIEYPGLMRWELFACLICAWLMVYFATWKSIKSSAKVRYFTATFPFILIIILMGRAVTLDGAHEGLRYFFRPNWSELKNANVWINAASQNFNSLGITFGSMISFASYNKYNNNILRDTVAVSVVNILTSLLVGVFAFATLGNLALEQNTNVRDVIGDGPGLIFVVYPQAMAKMPYAQLWAVMFFFMLLCLGLNSQFAIVEVVVTSIQDGFPNWIRRHLGYHEIVVLIVCVVSFLFGLPNLIQGGIYFFQLMDHYAASVSIMFLAFCQMIAIAWFYGTGRLSKNIKQMTGKAPSLYLKSSWLLLGPCLLFAIWILSLINYQEPTYHNGRYKYPDWAYGIGWMFASFSLICIPGYALINFCRASGNTFWERLHNTLRPNIYECRICGEHHCEHDYNEQEQYMLAHEMTGMYKPVMMDINPTAPLQYQMSPKPQYNELNLRQQQQQHQDHPDVETENIAPHDHIEEQSQQTTTMR